MRNIGEGGYGYIHLRKCPENLTERVFEALAALDDPDLRQVEQQDAERAAVRSVRALRVQLIQHGPLQRGRGIEGTGIPPHEIVPYDPEDLAEGRDTLLLRAEALLEKYPRGKVPYDPGNYGWRR